MHIRNISTSIAQNAGLIRKYFKALGNDDVVLRFIMHLSYLVMCSGQYSFPSFSLLNKIFKNIAIFAVPTHANLQTSWQNERKFVLSRHNTTQFELTNLGLLRL